MHFRTAVLCWKANLRIVSVSCLPTLHAGLVHRTHMSSCRVDKPSEMVDVGDKVWVKLIGKEVTSVIMKYPVW